MLGFVVQQPAIRTIQVRLFSLTFPQFPDTFEKKGKPNFCYFYRCKSVLCNFCFSFSLFANFVFIWLYVDKYNIAHFLLFRKIFFMLLASLLNRADLFFFFNCLFALKFYTVILFFFFLYLNILKHCSLMLDIFLLPGKLTIKLH